MSGRSLICWLVMTVPTVESTVFSSGAAAATVICSATSPSCSVRVDLADVADVEHDAALRRSVLKPGELDADRRSRRCAAAACGTARAVGDHVVVVLVSRWVTPTVAPGTAASLESTTVPTTTAVLACCAVAASGATRRSDPSTSGLASAGIEGFVGMRTWVGVSRMRRRTRKKARGVCLRAFRSAERGQRLKVRATPPPPEDRKPDAGDNSTWRRWRRHA